MINLVQLAQHYALGAHHNQRYGDGPFSRHLQMVHTAVLSARPDDIELQAAAWLHDILEDTQVQYKELKDLFGVRVAELVFLVTDGQGRNRKERKLAVFAKILDVYSKFLTDDLPQGEDLARDAIALKLADRIANISDGLAHNHGRIVSMYFKEHADLVGHLQVGGHNQDLWDHLDSLVADGVANGYR